MPARNDTYKCTRIVLLLEAIVATVLLILGFVVIAVPVLILALITSLCAASGCLCNGRFTSRSAQSGADVDVVTVPSPSSLRDSLGLTSGERNRLLLDTTSPPEPMRELLKRRTTEESSLGKPSMQVENDGCSICLLPYLEGDSLGRRLPCGHIFHNGCIDSWADKQAVCPLCRESFAKGFDTKGTIFQ